MDDEPLKPSSRWRGLFWPLLVSVLIISIPLLWFAVPLENRVAMKLQSQGFWIIHSPDGWWYYPTHFGNVIGSAVTVTDETLVELRSMPHIFSIIFFDTDLSRVDLELLADVPSMHIFGIINKSTPARSPKDITKLAGCKQLELLHLAQIPLTAKEIEPLKSCPLKHLRFVSSGLTDADASVFTLFPDLKTLQLDQNSGITDASLAVFETIPTLNGLDILKTGVTKEGVEAFQKKRPDVELRTDWMDTRMIRHNSRNGAGTPAQ